MNKEPPNLFDYATSELSQDAFFAWLLANADSCYGGAVHDFARVFLRRVLESAGKHHPSGDLNIEVHRQYKNIDVFCKINGTEFALIIEDKVHTSEHGTQLSDYREAILSERIYSEIVCVYCKTGDQSNVEKVQHAGYTVIDRKTILDIFDSEEGKNASSNNQIIRDFKKHLQSMEMLVKRFETIPLTEWDWNDWKGFYMALQAELKDGDWDYVSNPAGGFMGFWWHWNGVKGGSVYLQLEQEKACFKVEVDDWDSVQALKVDWNTRFIAACESYEGLNIRAVRPRVLRIGTWMTVAVLDKEYRVEVDGHLDLSATIRRLHEMEMILDMAVKNSAQTINSEIGK